MEAHWFEQGPVALGICKQCGREKNDYQYHFVEQTNVKWSEPSPSEQACRGIMPTSYRVAELERQVAVLTGFVRALAHYYFGPVSADRFLAEMEEAKG